MCTQLLNCCLYVMFLTLLDKEIRCCLTPMAHNQILQVVYEFEDDYQIDCHGISLNVLHRYQVKCS